MDVRILELGLFEKYNDLKQTRHCNSIQVNNFYNDTAFHFELKISGSEDYQITASGGYFSPSKVETTFYEKQNKNSNNSQLIERQPNFFVLLLPYPHLQKTSPRFKHPSDEWAFNCKPFANGRFQDDIKTKRFSYSTLHSDLTEKVVITHPIRRNSRINDFVENNCYPIFIEDHDELCTLMNDYSSFVKSTMNIDLHIQSFSKIVIPFFELDESEAKQLSNTKSDTLPF